ncbi:sedoheptulose-7-phosphate:D-glyceraldehyde-3-phosphate transaldolase NQM1 [Saccharomyces paradoxus]|uniref:Transaldolase n=1 Tax=Saccharomyces paradoxus TaxID=27291 RepID=A0A8B8URI1_SACPA|nr:Nqm1 [Saccharomyces paradoxus]QHS73360.1 Nqm1 [Saccharomyces paradoxus]
MSEPSEKKQKVATSSLDQLKKAGTHVVADSGDFEAISKYEAQDSTTNPSLILAASKLEKYARFIDTAVEYGRKHGKTDHEKIENAMDKILVEFGTQILKIVPGRVSTEVDARLSFDKKATVKKALHIIKLYKDAGVPKERVLIKIASTWEGIQAARELEAKHGIHCNMTLLFSFTQAVACAEANVTLISPFVGRIMDFYKALSGKDYTAETDPGVLSVKKIYSYYKKHGYATEVMAASFRNLDELKALAGIDNMTLPLNLLEQLYESTDPIDNKLNAESAKKEGVEKVSFINDEPHFRYVLNEDQMATEKLSDGIRKFSADIEALYKLVEEKM